MTTAIAHKLKNLRKLSLTPCFSWVEVEPEDAWNRFNGFTVWKHLRGLGWLEVQPFFSHH